MSTNGPGGSISVAATNGYYFANARMGDLIIRGTGSTETSTSPQQILFGTQVDSSRGASLLVSPSNIRSYVPRLSFSNDTGEGFFATIGSNFGINKANPTAMLDVQGDGIFSSKFLVMGAATLSNGVTVDKSAVISSNLTVNSNAFFWGNMDLAYNANFHSNLTVDKDALISGSAEVAKDLKVDGTSTFVNPVICGSNLTIQGELRTNAPMVMAGNVNIEADMHVTGRTFTSNLNVYGVSSFSNIVFIDSNLTVTGVATLNSNVTVMGVSSFSNDVFTSSTLHVLSNANVYGVTSLSNNLFVKGASVTTGAVTTLGVLSQSNAAFFSSNQTVQGVATFNSNVVVEGTLTVNNLTYQYSNVTVFQSEEIKSNLKVDNNLEVGCNQVAHGYVSFSNSTSNVTLYSGASNLGVNNASPAFTLDVLGDINFSGKIYQAGAIFSGWNSNAFGNYINSNAAFKGATTSNDVVLLYTSNDYASGYYNSTLAFSNAQGKASVFNSDSNIGIGRSNPRYALDILGDVNFSGKIYQNDAIFSGWNSNAFGNYINSNAAFRGATSPSNVLTLFTSNGGGTLAFAFSNTNTANGAGEAKVYSAYSNVGFSKVAPVSTVDVEGDLQATNGLFGQSNGVAGGISRLFYSNMRAPSTGSTFVAGGFSGDVIATGSLWSDSFFGNTAGMMSRLSLVGSSATVQSAAKAYVKGALPQGVSSLLTDASSPLGSISPFLYLPTGDTLTSNLVSTGNVVVTGSTYVDGSLQANYTHTKMIKLCNSNVSQSNGSMPLNFSYSYPAQGIRSNADTKVNYADTNLIVDGFLGDGGFSNCHVTNNVLADQNLMTRGGVWADSCKARTLVLNGLQSTAYDYKSSNAMVLSAPADVFAGMTDVFASNALLTSNLALKVVGHSALKGSLGVQDNVAVGGMVLLGSNLTATDASAYLRPGRVGANLPGSTILGNLFLDVQGDTMVEGHSYVHLNHLVGSNVGVGTATPSYPVDIQSTTSGISLNCAGKVMATEFSVQSDRRIKTDVVDSDINAQLAAIMQLKVCQFAYIDGQDKGTGTKTGFIAQQVGGVLPSCVTPTSDFVPNVMLSLPIASYEAVGRAGATLDVSSAPRAARDLLAVGARVKCRTADATVLGEVSSVDEAAATVTLLLDSGIAADAASLFVVGTKISDFNVLNYEQINTIAIGALQAQQIRLEALEAKVAAINP